MRDDVKVILRPYNADQDQAFIYATWRNGAYYGSPERHKIANAKEFFKAQTKAIKETIKTAKIKIACFENTPEVITGYVVWTDKHLNWIFVKDAFRSKGIAKLMCPKDIESATSKITKVGLIIAQKKNLIIKGE